MAYVDGFLLIVSTKNIPTYRRIARLAGKVWREHGALDYKECVGDDLHPDMPMTFPKQLKLKKGETVVFSWVLYKSRAHRNKVVKQVMKDPRLAASMDPKKMPFDMKRMSYGGFKVLVDA